MLSICTHRRERTRTDVPLTGPHTRAGAPQSDHAQHNNANVLAIGGRTTGPEVAKDIVDAWLGASFQGGRHSERVAKIAALE